MARKPEDFWLWRRSMTGAPAPRRLKSAVGLQTVRDWVLRFNAHGPDGLLDGKAPGQPSILSQEHRQHLIQMIEDGPIPAVHGVVR